MLNPKYLDNLPHNMVELYSQAEMDILADMARRISTYDYFIPAAQFQYQKLIEMGNFHSFIVQALALRTGRTRQEIERLMEESGQKALAFDDAIYRKAGLSPVPLAESSALQAVLQAGTTRTNGLFVNLTRTTANTAARQFEAALDQAYMQITSGAFDRGAAIRNAVKDLAEKGVATIRYPTRYTDYMEVAVRRAILTGVNQNACKLQEARADEMGCDLVETSAHAGARPEHALWQGKVFSRSGRDPKYPDFVASTGYGTGEGLGGWNCRHSYYPFYEGISDPGYSRQELAEMNARTIEYNGQKMTEYEASQQQRHIERKIRRWKREYATMEASGLPTEAAAAKIAKWQNIQKDFVRKTGFKRQGDREQIAGFGRGEAARVTASVKAAAAGSYIKSSLKQKTIQGAQNWAVNKLGIGQVDYSGRSLDIANGINSALSRIFKEYPLLNGFLDEVRFENMPSTARATLSHRNGVIRAKLTFSDTQIADIKTLEQIINQAVSNQHWSPKAGLYGIVKHESAHLAEYAATLNKYGVSKTGSPAVNLQQAFDAIRRREISTDIRRRALIACNFPDDNNIIKAELSDYANENSSEFLAEAVSEHNPRRLAKTTVKLFKQLLGVK